MLLASESEPPLAKEHKGKGPRKKKRELKKHKPNALTLIDVYNVLNNAIVTQIENKNS